MFDVNSVYIANILIVASLVALGAVAGFFLARGQAQSAKNAGQDKTITTQKELIDSLGGRITELEKQIVELREKNRQLQATVDNLVVEKESRERTRQTTRKPTP